MSLTNNSDTMKPLANFWLLCLFLAVLNPSVYEVSSTKSIEDFLDPSVDYEDNHTNEAPTRGPTIRPGPTPALENCYKSLCNDLPAPCHQLAAESGCRCPGVSLGPGAQPEAPAVKVFMEAGAASEVRWCAAAARDISYRVLVGGKLVGEFGELKRTMVVKDLSAGVEVCVQAVNDFGQSKLEGKACEVYKPSEKGGSLGLKVGLIGGALGLLLLIVITVLLWRHCSRRKNGAHVSNNGVL